MDEQNLFFALTNCIPGQEEEFNRWYNTEHVPDVLKLPAFKAARRYRLHESQREPGPGMRMQRTPPWTYLCIYEIEGDVPELHREVSATLHLRTQSPALLGDHQAWVWTPIGERIVKRKAK